MTSIGGALAGWIASLNEQGPWGGRGSGGGGDGDKPRNPWDLPPRGERGSGPRRSSAVDEIVGRMRARVGPGGGLPINPNNRSLWVYGLVALLVAWLVFTSFHRIDPQERGVVTRLGKYSHTLEPGVSLTFPAPIDRVRAVDVQNIRTLDIPQGSAEKLVLTGDQNIIDLDYSVRWNIKSPEQYLFQLREPESTITAVAESAMRAAIANVSLNDAIGSGRTGVEAEVATRMQALLDAYQAGIRIQGIAIKRADPPEAVNEAFKDVTAAQQNAQASINQANAYAQQILAKAQGEAAQFDRVYVQYKAAPGVTRRRMYYETMEDVLAKTDKTIVEPGVTAYLPLPGRNTPPAAQQQQGAQ